MKSKEIISIVHSSDRIIYTIWNEQELIAVNFMYGADDLDQFEEFKKNDEELREFIQKRMDNGRYAYDNDISAIDRLIDDYISIQYAREALDEVKESFKKLSDLWLENNSQSEINSYLCKNYPFIQDFNELTQDVMKWGEDE